MNRLAAAQRGVPPTAGRKVLPGGTTLTAEQAAQLAASVRAAAAKQAEEAGEGAPEGEGKIKIGERGHMDVDELVKYIQGAVPSNKPARGAKNLRGKRRTGAKR
jgi:protein TIF31